MNARLIPLELIQSCAYLSEAHQKHLFGSAYEMRIAKPRPWMKGQFLYCETLRILGAKETSLHLPIFGPSWEETTLELAPEDAKTLEVSSSATLQGPSGVVKLKEGVVVPGSRLYCSPEEATLLGVGQDDRVELCLSDRPTVVFQDVLVRVHPTYALLFQLSPKDLACSEARSGMTVQLVIS